MGVWLLMSGHYDITHISMGVISVAMVVALNYRLRKYYFFQEEIAESKAKVKDLHPVRLRTMQMILYIPWLIWQIVVASLQVAAVVLSPKMPIDPAMLKFKTKLPNDSAKVILGNSITLTPGTITVQVKEDEFMVHALMDASFTGIQDDSLPAAVAKLYDKTPKHVVRDMKIIKSGAEL